MALTNDAKKAQATAGPLVAPFIKFPFSFTQLFIFNIWIQGLLELKYVEWIWIAESLLSYDMFGGFQQWDSFSNGLFNRKIILNIYFINCAGVTRPFCPSAWYKDLDKMYGFFSQDLKLGTALNKTSEKVRCWDYNNDEIVFDKNVYHGLLGSNHRHLKIYNTYVRISIFELWKDFTPLLLLRENLTLLDNVQVCLIYKSYITVFP